MCMYGVSVQELELAIFFHYTKVTIFQKTNYIIYIYFFNFCYDWWIYLALYFERPERVHDQLPYVSRETSNTKLYRASRLGIRFSSRTTSSCSRRTLLYKMIFLNSFLRADCWTLRKRRLLWSLDYKQLSRSTRVQGYFSFADSSTISAASLFHLPMREYHACPSIPLVLLSSVKTRETKIFNRVQYFYLKRYSE